MRHSITFAILVNLILFCGCASAHRNGAEHYDNFVAGKYLWNMEWLGSGYSSVAQSRKHKYIKGILDAHKAQTISDIRQAVVELDKLEFVNEQLKETCKMVADLKDQVRRENEKREEIISYILKKLDAKLKSVDVTK